MNPILKSINKVTTREMLERWSFYHKYNFGKEERKQSEDTKTDPKFKEKN